LLTVIEDGDLQPDRLAAMMERELALSDRSAGSINLDGAAATAACIRNWPANHRGKPDAS
jgi:predicted glycosyltransferase